jgi:cytochrome P450
MLSKLSQVHPRLGRGLLARAVGQDFDLSRVRTVPKSLRLPLLRDGLDPVPALAEVRAAEPVSRLASFFGRTIWVTTGSEEARALLADPSSFSNDIRPLVGSVQATGAHSIGGLGFTDPPDHPRLRRILTPEFTVRRLERLRPRIAEIVDRQLQVVADAGPVVDLVQTFAFPIPFLVICELLGLPDEDREEFHRIGNARFDVTQGGVGAFGAASESREFLLAATRRQRANPGDGLLGAIITELGEDIDDTTLSGLADGVFLGGYETTASMLALGALTLLQSSDGRVAVGEGEQASADVVEELLRYLSVVQVAFPRFARRDMEVYGKQIVAGDVMLFSLSGANRDGRLASAMDAFDPRRQGIPHLAFGHGFHRCVGAELARMELRTAYPALLQRFPQMRLAVLPESLRFHKLSIVYGVDSLPVVPGPSLAEPV